jgi:hypothetical protein
MYAEMRFSVLDQDQSPKTSNKRGRRKEGKTQKPIRIKLRDGRIGDSTHDVYLFLGADGKPISVDF